MNLFFAANNNYFCPTKVMLTSFLENNRNEEHNLYFMYQNVCDQHLKEIGKLAKEYDARMHLIKIDEERVSCFLCTARYPVEAYFRFLIMDYLPDTETRALWLDVDTIVNGQLDDFYYQDFENCCMIACKDIDTHEEKLRGFGAPLETHYVNSGVIVYNALQMRKYNISDYVRYYQENKNLIKWFDQDIINGMFAGKIKVEENNRVNMQRHWCAFSKEEMNEMLLVHFIGGNKPWRKEYTHPCSMLWDKYYAVAYHHGNWWVLFSGLRRGMEKKAFGPFRKMRSRLYSRSVLIRKIRALVRKRE